jgi:ssDNA-binding replication factor A large subunit
MQNQSSSNQTYIKDLKPNLKNLNLQAIVLDICKPTQTKDGNEVRSVRIADRSGSINLSVWNNYGSLLKEGDIIKLTGCYTQIWKLSLQLKISTKGTLFKCGDFMMIFSEQPDMSVLSAGKILIYIKYNRIISIIHSIFRRSKNGPRTTSWKN